MKHIVEDKQRAIGFAVVETARQWKEVCQRCVRRYRLTVVTVTPLLIVSRLGEAVHQVTPAQLASCSSASDFITSNVPTNARLPAPPTLLEAIDATLSAACAANEGESDSPRQSTSLRHHRDALHALVGLRLSLPPDNPHLSLHQEHV